MLGTQFFSTKTINKQQKPMLNSHAQVLPAATSKMNPAIKWMSHFRANMKQFMKLQLQPLVYNLTLWLTTLPNLPCQLWDQFAKNILCFGVCEKKGIFLLIHQRKPVTILDAVVQNYLLEKGKRGKQGQRQIEEHKSMQQMQITLFIKLFKRNFDQKNHQRWGETQGTY